MFEFSLVELLLVAVVGLLVIGPEDMPKVLRAIIKVWREIHSLVSDVRKSVNQMVDETGLNEVRREMTTILDQDGNPQPTYDISEFLETDETPKTRILREEDVFDGKK
jgi:Tat protein translocase TatB subunit